MVENHYGAHAEKIVYINFVADKTLEPDHNDQRFIVDAWAAGKFNLDVPKFLVTAAATVEKLTKGALKDAILIVPKVPPPPPSRSSTSSRAAAGPPRSSRRPTPPSLREG